MSYEEEISTLFARDLDNSRENERKIIADIHKLADENRALRRSLSLLQQNATLRTAKLISELVIWVDNMVETFQCSVTIPESTKSVGIHKEKSAFRPISPAFDGQNKPAPEIIVTSASQNLAQALSPVPEFFKPKIIIPESERLKSPYDLSQRGAISKGDFFSQRSIIPPTFNRLEVRQGPSRPKSPGIYKSKISQHEKPTVDFSGNWTEKTAPLIQPNFPEHEAVRQEESDSGSTGRDVTFHQEPFEDNRSKYNQKDSQKTFQGNSHPPSLSEQSYQQEHEQEVPRDRESQYQRTKSPMPNQTPRETYDERNKGLMPEQRTGDGYDQRRKSPMPEKISREIYDMRSKSPMPEQSPRERYDERSRRNMLEQRTRENFDERSKILMPDQRAGQGYEQKSTDQMSEQKVREMYDKRSSGRLSQQRYVAEPEQNIPMNREFLYQSSKFPMSDQRARENYDQRSRSLEMERRYDTQPGREEPNIMEIYDQTNKSLKPEPKDMEGFNRGRRSPMPEQKDKEKIDQGRRSPIPQQRAREKINQGRSISMPERRTRERYDHESKSHMPEQRALEGYDQRSRSLMPEQRVREGYDQRSRSLMPQQRAMEEFDQRSRGPMPEQRVREGFDQRSRSLMPEQRAREEFDQGSRIPMSEQSVMEGFDQRSRGPMPEQRVREGFDQRSRSPMPQQRVGEGSGQRSKSLMPEQRVGEGFDQRSRSPMPQQRAMEGFDQRSRSPMPQQRAMEGFDQRSRGPMPEQRVGEGFDQRSRNLIPEQRVKEGSDQRSRIPMPEQSFREGFDQESRSPMSEQRNREMYDQRSLAPKQECFKEATLNEQDKYVTETKIGQGIPKNQENYDKRSRDSRSERRVSAETNNLSKSPTPERSQRSDYGIEELESMDHMLSAGQQRKQVNDNSDAVVPQHDSSLEKNLSVYSKSDQRSVGEDRTGRNVVGDPIATSTPKTQRGVGEPIATSTPKTREEKLADSIMNKVNPPISRPIDQLIGIDPTMTQARWLKAAMIRKNKRLIGEIAFQMDRRILEYVFAWDSGSKNAKKRRYYGFSIANIGSMIQKEAVQPDGSRDARKELEMRKRFENLVRTLAKLGYNLDQHGEFSQDMVNKYGLLSGPPSRKMVAELGLEDPMVLRVLFSQLIEDEKELNNVLVLLDCLCLLAYEDKRPLFMW
ncbi:serine/arginine repetitive matrix protein 2-like isoform X2 [Saccostrea cucullata]|uniref:serine/arginine repetitive matrix protein 2-like isoform X2 n=1 Tax=Saccostrea cuccullata TaxID=36930 RepID=UPI002ED212B4